MKLTNVVAIAAVGSAAFSLGAYTTSAESVLKQVIVVSRHGVRGPYGLGTETPSEEILKQYIRNPQINLPLSAVEWGTSDDPNEGVSPKLTKHGYKVVEQMGDYFRKHLYHAFLEETPCKQALAYADANQRDNLTAEAFLGGAFAACEDVVPITNGTQLLFEQGQDPTATCPVCSRATYQGIAGADDCRYLVQEYHREIQHLNSILDCCAPQVCGMTPPPPPSPQASEANSSNSNSSSRHGCSFFGIPSIWDGAFYQPWRDTLSSADYFTEFLMLQALNNMTLPHAFPFEKVQELAKIHEAHMDLVTNDINSANFGSTLLAHITASFEQRATGKVVHTPPHVDGPVLDQGPNNRFLFYAGHDINILYLRNLLRMQWFTRGWHPHQPTPGGMLVFELREWSKSPGGSGKEKDVNATMSRRRRRLLESQENPTFDHHFVQAYFVTATPEQMRNGEILSPLNAPDVVPVVIPFCTEDELLISDGTHMLVCPFNKFKKLVGRLLKHECVADTLRPFVDSLDGSGAAPANARSGLHTILWVVFALLVLVFAAVVAHNVAAQRRQRSSTVAKPEYGTLPQVAAE